MISNLNWNKRVNIMGHEWGTETKEKMSIKERKALRKIKTSRQLKNSCSCRARTGIPTLEQKGKGGKEA